MRWRAYNGDRIPRPGLRTTVRYLNKQRLGPPIQLHGCVWPSGLGWEAYYERREAGQLVDVMLGRFDDLRGAQRAVADALLDPANRPSDAAYRY